MRAYISSIEYSDDPTKGGCDTASAFEYTNCQGFKCYIVLCPQSFFGFKLHEKGFTAILGKYFRDHDDPPGQKTSIQDVLPAGRTLNHELFHLHWGEDMYPSGGEEYAFRRMTGNAKRDDGTKLTKSQAMWNSENYDLQATVPNHSAVLISIAELLFQGCL